MVNLSELESIIEDPQRKIIVSEDFVDLSSSSSNLLFIIMIDESVGAAGGRAGGFGQRTIARVLCFKVENSFATKILDTNDENILSSIDLPIGIARVPAIMSDKSEEMVYGVVDPDLVRDYCKVLLK
jgi:hypothetical protein